MFTQLFSGTIRNNIDPFDMYTEDQIWKALHQCYMYDTVIEMQGGLDAPVAEYGENLSAGMRQMLVLGRALLRQCRASGPKPARKVSEKAASQHCGHR